MTIRQAKKIFKASFTYWRYLSIKGWLQDFRSLPYWSCDFSMRHIGTLRLTKNVVILVSEKP